MLNMKKMIKGHNLFKFQSPITLLFTDQLLPNRVCRLIKHYGSFFVCYLGYFEILAATTRRCGVTVAIKAPWNDPYVAYMTK